MYPSERSEVNPSGHEASAPHRHQAQQRKLEKGEDVFERSERLRELDVEIPRDRAHDGVCATGASAVRSELTRGCSSLTVDPDDLRGELRRYFESQQH